MTNIKLFNIDKKSLIILFSIIFVILVNAIINKDYYPAVISAVCGITYTFLAGKGYPVCYIFGAIGSSFYVYLSYKNMLWGNLLLYALYYIPMQIFGFFQWNKNLQENSSRIQKITLPKKDFRICIFAGLLLSVLLITIMYFTKDSNPVLDGITTALSILGMYLTVKRAIEQWYAWGIVNAMSAIMWFIVALSGQKVYSTVIMWTVLLFFAFYFYFEWKKEIQTNITDKSSL